MEQYTTAPPLFFPGWFLFTNSQNLTSQHTFCAKINVCLHGQTCATCCWQWLGSTHRKYGRTRRRLLSGKLEGMAHRAIWMLTHQQEIPPDMEIGHTCDVPACVNPQHLWLCTHQENMDDMGAKGRRGRRDSGEEHHSAKLTPTDVQTIWRLRIIERLPFHVIAATMGVTKGSIVAIIRRKNWKHVASDRQAEIPKPRLTLEQLRCIWHMHSIEKKSQRAIAAALGIHQGTVCRIINRKAWKHADFDVCTS